MPEKPVKEIREYWEAIHLFTTHIQVVLYRIENLVVYEVYPKDKVIIVKANEGEVIPKIAKPISREEYESYLLRYMT